MRLNRRLSTLDKQVQKHTTRSEMKDENEKEEEERRGGGGERKKKTKTKTYNKPYVYE